MGCGDSKIKNINLSPDPDDHIEMTKTSGNKPEQKIETITDKLDDGLPNRLLSAIPISDLGESLDSRHLSESFNGALGKMKSKFFESKIALEVGSSPSITVQTSCG